MVLGGVQAKGTVPVVHVPSDVFAPDCRLATPFHFPHRGRTHDVIETYVLILTVVGMLSINVSPSTLQRTFMT